MATAIIVDEHLTDCPLLLLPVEKSRTHGRGRAAFQTKLWEKIILLVITDGNLTLLSPSLAAVPSEHVNVDGWDSSQPSFAEK